LRREVELLFAASGDRDDVPAAVVSTARGACRGCRSSVILLLDSEMLPAWGTIVVSLAGAVIAGTVALAGLLVRARQERELKLRERQIAAAADFAFSALRTIAAVRDVARTHSTGDEEARDKALALLHETEAHQGVLSLFLFEEKRGAAPGNKIINLLRDAVAKIDTERTPDNAELESIRDCANKADKELAPFYDAVGDVLKGERRR
jgi:hypothetical protein